MIITYQFNALVRALSNQSVNIPHHLQFRFDAVSWTGIDFSLMAALRLTHRMKDLDNRNAKPPSYFSSDPARHPEIAVKQIVAYLVTFHEAEQGVTKIGHVGPK